MIDIAILAALIWIVVELRRIRESKKSIPQNSKSCLGRYVATSTAEGDREPEYLYIFYEDGRNVKVRLCK